MRGTQREPHKRTAISPKWGNRARKKLAESQKGTKRNDMTVEQGQTIIDLIIKIYECVNEWGLTLGIVGLGILTLELCILFVLGIKR